MNKVKTITITFEDGSQKTIESDGFAVWVEGKDLFAEFFETEAEEVLHMLNAVRLSIVEAMKMEKALLKQH